MANELPGFKPPSFFQRPGSIMSMLPIIAAGVAAFIFWGEVSDFVVRATDDLLHFMVDASALILVVWMAFDSKVRNFLWYGYYGFMRWLTCILVNYDPIAILRGYLAKMRAKKEEFQKALNDLNGQKVATEQDTKVDTKEYNTACAMYESALKQGNQRVVEVQGKKIARYRELLEEDHANMKQMFTIMVVLSRYRDVCDDTITDWADEIKVRERRSQRAGSLRRAMSAALGMLKGLPNDEEIKDMAIQRLDFEWSQKMGEVEQALDLTKSIVANANVKDGAAQDAAKKLFEEWKASNGHVDFGGVTKEQLINDAQKQADQQFALPAPGAAMTVTSFTAAPAGVPVARDGNPYNDLFRK